MASADEESHGLNLSPREMESREAGLHAPAARDRRNGEHNGRERPGGMRRLEGTDGSLPHVLKERMEDQDRECLEGGAFTDDSRIRNLSNCPAKQEILHDASADVKLQQKQNDVAGIRPNESAADTQDSKGTHSQRNVDDACNDHLKKRHADSAIDNRSRSRHDSGDASGRQWSRRRDDDAKVHEQSSHGGDDVCSDRMQRRQQEDDNSEGQRSRKRQEVDDLRRKRNVDNAWNARDERRRDTDDTHDSHRQRRDLHAISGDRNNRHDVDDARHDSRRRHDAEDVRGDSSRRRRDGDRVLDSHRRGRHDTEVVPGDSNRRRHDDDRVLDNHSQRRRDVYNSSNNRRHHVDGEREQQERSPHRRRSHSEKRGADEDGGRDRFSERFRNAEGNDDELPELFSVHRAKVQSVRPFGVFVRLEGFSKQGLVHLSQLSDHEVTDREDSDATKVQAIAAVAAEGDQVWVKVISLKDDGGGVKIGCSLKWVSQSTGKDLDPSNVKLEQQQPKGTRQELKKVTLDAIYNVVCSRCGGHGHLKTECYGMANKSYELLPEENDNPTPLPSQSQLPLGEASVKPGFGRGRAMVLPAWMTHGSGANPLQHLGSETLKEKKKSKASELPDQVTTVEEAMALIAQVKKAKKEKHHRKEHKKHKDKSNKSGKRSSSSRKDRD